MLLTIETSPGLEPIRTRRYAREYRMRTPGNCIVASVTTLAVKDFNTYVFSNQVPPSSGFFS